ncbi:C40 family peptidase [Saccharopolyspora sp. MS10]|uniref:C40 family peptidase n=1 Tax=Saccharopolyspora sp. MS10 TaxID=3385973 RepID=UPI0039A309CE
MPGARATWALAAALVYLVGTPGLIIGVALLAVVGAATAGCGTGVGPVGGGQVGDHHWSGEQLTHAQTITGIAEQRRLPQRAAVLALSTAIVESNLINVPYGDRDSLGLFQQRPSQGWGSAEQVSDPIYATNAFLDRLIALEDWWRLPPGVAQQTVQASAYPERYAPQEGPATDLMSRFWRGPDNPLPPTGATPVAQAALCGDEGGASTPLDPQQLPPGYRLPAEPTQRAAVRYALAQLGKPYVFGAKGPDAFDCSGLMRAAWAHAGVPISAGTTSQVHDGRAVAALRQLAPGDLVFIPGSLGSPANPRHVGMYAGHGLIVNAYDESTGVVLEQLDAWKPQVVAIRRVAEPRGANA